MLSRTETYSTTGTKQSWNLDPSIVPFNASVAFVLSAGTVSYKLQYTYDELTPTQTDNDASWFDSTTFAAATAATKDGQITAPVTRVRVVIAALSGGTLKMTVLQGFSTN